MQRGLAAVVPTGSLSECEIVTGIRPVKVKVPKRWPRTDEPVVFKSALVLPYVRRARTLNAAFPWLSRKEISTGQMQEALEVLVGPDAKGPSPSVVRRHRQ